MEKILKGKRIIITAGPVWVPIDRVRVITSVFGGLLGVIIAKTAKEMGADVLLLMGPGRAQLEEDENLKIVKFKYFEELFNLMKKEISSKKYDIVIHSSAVPDYVPYKVFDGKIESGNKNLTIKLKPTIKIVDYIKKWDPSVNLVKFKLQVGFNKKKLIEVAYKSMMASRADIIVANDFNEMRMRHSAFIIDEGKKVITCSGKENIAKKLLVLVAKKI